MTASRTRRIDDFGPGAWLLWLALLVAIFAPAARAQSKSAADEQFDRVFAALEQKDYKTAWNLLAPLMKEEHRRAYYVAGYLTEYGQGVTKDGNAAMAFYKKSADLGFDPAMNNLGTMLRDAELVPQDYAQALKYFTSAALRGNTQAQLNAGAMYANGTGVKSDFVEAYAWFTLCADPVAKQNLPNIENKMSVADVNKSLNRVDEIRAEMKKFENNGESQVDKDDKDEPSGPAKPGTVRITLQMNDRNEFIVKRVGPGSEAERCDLQPGDALLEVDGKDVTKLSGQELGKMIEGPAGSNIQMRLRRGTTNVQVAMPRDEMESTATSRSTEPIRRSDMMGKWSIGLPANWTKRAGEESSSAQIFAREDGATVRIDAQMVDDQPTTEKYATQKFIPAIEKAGGKIQKQAVMHNPHLDGFAVKYTTSKNAPGGAVVSVIDNQWVFTIEVTLPAGPNAEHELDQIFRSIMETIEIPR